MAKKTGSQQTCPYGHPANGNGKSGVVLPVLTGAQADGLACVVCGTDFLSVPVAHRPVGRSHTGSQVFACSVHVADQVAEVAGGPEESSVALLSSALADAVIARAAGVIVGPAVDELALRRAVGRAVRQDVARGLGPVPGDAA